jgi:hypothetical protein
MKTLGSPVPFLMILVFMAAIIYSISIAGCNNTITNSINDNIYQARSERDFVDNRDLQGFPGAVIAINLEDFNSPAVDSIPDTGTIGEDIIPMRYIENATHSIRMESSAHHDAYLINVETGEWVYYISPFNNNVTVYIPAGDYEMHFTSWQNFEIDSSATPKTLFIRPESDKLNMVISSGGCQNCDLSLANLQYMSFPLMNFSGSNLSKADLGHTNLLGTNFSHSNLNGTYFYQSYMPYAELSYSSMQGVILRSTNLEHANVGASDLTNADIRFADISYTNFCGSTLTGVITNGIFWNAPPQCWP